MISLSSEGIQESHIQTAQQVLDPAVQIELVAAEFSFYPEEVYELIGGFAVYHLHGSAVCYPFVSELPDNNSTVDTDTLHIDRINVDPDRQNIGIGFLLAANAVWAASAIGFERITANINSPRAVGMMLNLEGRTLAKLKVCSLGGENLPVDDMSRGDLKSAAVDYVSNNHDLDSNVWDSLDGANGTREVIVEFSLEDDPI